MFELGALWKQKFFELIIFLYVFFLVSRCTTAGFSILTGLTILMLLCNHKYWYSIIVEFPKSFFFCYMTFFLSLFISALLSDKSIVIFDTWRYFTWTFPFFIIYFFVLNFIFRFILNFYFLISLKEPIPLFHTYFLNSTLYQLTIPLGSFLNYL